MYEIEIKRVKKLIFVLTSKYFFVNWHSFLSLNKNAEVCFYFKHELVNSIYVHKLSGAIFILSVYTV